MGGGGGRGWHAPRTLASNPKPVRRQSVTKGTKKGIILGAQNLGVLLRKFRKNWVFGSKTPNFGISMTDIGNLENLLNIFGILGG